MQTNNSIGRWFLNKFATFSAIFRFGRLVVATAVLLASNQSEAAVLSWSGASITTANWSDNANWGFAGVPTNGDTLIFPAAQPRQANSNDISGLTLNQIRFVGAGGGYVINGNAFAM